MKKITPYLLLLLGLVLLTACGSKEPAPTENNLTQTIESTSQADRIAQCTVQSQAVADLAKPDDFITGASENYTVTIINYSDFTCDNCATIAAGLSKALELYPDDIRLIYRHYTSPAKNPLVAARAVEAAGNQGQFGSMYEAFYSDYQPWVDLDEESFNNFIWQQVTALDLDPDQFFTDISSQELTDLVQEQYLVAADYSDLLKNSNLSARVAAAGEAAGRQNQFWPMYQQILSTYEDWQSMDLPAFDAYLLEIAASLQLDPDQFQQDYALLTYPEPSEDIYSRAVNYFNLFYRTPIGLAAAKAAEAAGMQGKFWQMHDLLFANQSLWSDANEQDFLYFISGQLETLQIDPEKFFNDYYSQAVEEKILDSYIEARGSGQPAPVVLVNGSPIPPYISTIGDFLLWLDNLMIPYGRHIRDQQFYDCPPMTIDTDSQYTATLHTEKGDVVLALYPEEAPLAVNSFIFLAEQGYYDNSPFYAVIEGFVVQAGDPSGTGWGNPGFLYDVETSEVTFNRPYMVAMANSGPGTNNSQFFITLNPLTHLNGKNTIFGEVIDGIDVLKSLTLRDPEKDPYAPLEDHILNITIDKK